MKEATGLDEQPYSLSSRPPAVPFPQSSVNTRVSPDRYGHANAGRGVVSDVLSLSARQHAAGYKSLPSAPGTEHLTSYKRLVQGDLAKHTDVPGRRSHTRLVRTRSKDSTSDPTAQTQYVVLCPSGTKVRRTKVSKKDRSEKPIAPGVSRSDMELSTLTRRSNTFVVDSVSKSPSSGLANHLEAANPDVNHQGSKEKMSEARRGETSHTAPDAVLTASERLLKKQEILSRLSERLSNEFEELPEESALPRKSKIVKKKFVLGREGARNPVQERKMAARPKSAGQLRYYDSDGSDDSSLDGEIEIVDIDKELQEDPSEPAPYYTGMEPLQIPEVQQDASYKQRPVGYRKRHGSGESELSAFSDTS
ncbi:hypothetical protein C0Q70_12141 [Pomacea canaliculata]|uniref:Uncharacterized protein n=1 Tax=Pomacea canaliculata TaxID=400727 RepID=A0A2T7P0P4_POMCA|nr:hypothetical protein C0Q70_12141 [Pomacea canaliculata]